MRKKPHEIWRYVEDLYKFLDDGTIELEENEEDFVRKLHEYLNPFDVREELSQKQIDWVYILADKYLDDGETLEELLE